jgi:NUDIX domain
MAGSLAATLAGYTVLAEESAIWNQERATPTPLHVTAYLTPELPPLDLVTSVRALVFHGDALLALTMPELTHVLPGGRREAAETPEATVRREIVEEAGWTIRSLSLLGVMRFHHLGPEQPQPPNQAYRYPYPDFLNLIYLAEGGHFDAATLIPNVYEQQPYTMQPITAVRTQPLTPVGHAFLDAALHQRRQGTR